MDLFSFIHHADTTKVKVGVMEKSSDQVPLLEATRGRVVPHAPPVLVTTASSEGNMTESIDRLFDERNDAEKEHYTRGGEYVALTEAIVEPVNEDVAEKPKSHCASGYFFCDHTNSVSSPNLRTKPAAVRFVISSHSSHHSGTYVVDVEVSSLVRSTISDPLVMTATVTTTAVVETSLVSVSKVMLKLVNPTLFGDSMSTSGHDVAGPSIPLDPPAVFSQLRAIEYDQLYTEFNVGAARQTCLGAEEKDAEISSLKSQLSLKEAEAVEAIRLRGHVATVEATEALHAAELNLLKERNSTLEAKMRAFEEKAAALESEKMVLLISNQVAGYELFKEQIEAIQDEQVRVLTEKIAEVNANLMGMAL
ncbi:hypothetical protein Tco_1242812, partial [Tanacetum coccineum]